ncbi:arylsulfatase B-like [Bolinopsis microptera]|uniref:arylsulfatase B-like n=1 Tax=Bolinopsis microptera TaxID=2820187 RepID=UPI00307A6DC3
MICFAFLCALSIVQSANSEEKQPNIIYILSDDLGHGDLGFAGGKIKTPNLDKLANEGVLLKQHYVQPICSPTRSALMSGRYPIHTGLQHFVILPGQPWGLPLDETIIPQILKEYNYSTHAVGKWHLGMHTWSYTPAHRGFDDFFGYYLGSQDYNTHIRGGGYDLRSDYWDENGQFVDDVRYDLKGQYSTELYTQRMVDLISDKKAQKNPFFIYMAYQNVHAPHMVPQRYIDQYSTHIKDGQEKTFAAMVSAMDEGIGNITAALEAAGLADNTVIVFSSDNGADVECVETVTASNFPYRGGKRSLYEGGLRSPSFVWAGGRLAHATSNALIHVTDWLPTFWGLASLQGKLKPNNPIKTKSLDGVNQWQTISENKASERTEILLNIDPYPQRCGHQLPNYGIRWKEWKLILGSGGPPNGWYPAPRLNDLETADRTCHKPIAGLVELYNIELDPYERRNVSDRYPHLVKKLTHKLMAYNATAVPPGNMATDPASDPIHFNHTWMPWMEDGEEVGENLRKNLWEMEEYNWVQMEVEELPDPCYQVVNNGVDL